MKDYTCPDKYIKHFKEYQEHGLCDNKFVFFCLCNNLAMAAHACEAEDLPKLPDVMKWIWDNIEQDRWGSENNVHAWSAFKDAQRKGDLMAYELFKQKARHLDIIRRKAERDAIEIMLELILTWTKGQTKEQLGITARIIDKAQLCLNGEYDKSVQIGIAK